MIARVLATNVIPEGKPTLELTKKLDEQDPKSAPKKLSIEERQKLLMELLQQEGRTIPVGRLDSGTGTEV